MQQFLGGVFGCSGSGSAVGWGDSLCTGSGGGRFSGDSFMEGNGDIHRSRDEFCGERWSGRPILYGNGGGETFGAGSVNFNGQDH